MFYEISFLKNDIYQSNIIEAESERFAERIFRGLNIDKKVEFLGIKSVEDIKPGQPVLGFSDLQLENINNEECRLVDSWKEVNNDFILGIVNVSPDFYMAEVNKGKSNHAAFEYDHYPTRSEVSDDYLDLESERALDEYDREYGADGSRVFPHLNDEPDQATENTIIRSRRGR